MSKKRERQSATNPEQKERTTRGATEGPVTPGAERRRSQRRTKSDVFQGLGRMRRGNPTTTADEFRRRRESLPKKLPKKQDKT